MLPTDLPSLHIKKYNNVVSSARVMSLMFLMITILSNSSSANKIGILH